MLNSILLLIRQVTGVYYNSINDTYVLYVTLNLQIFLHDIIKYGNSKKNKKNVFLLLAEIHVSSQRMWKGKKNSICHFFFGYIYVKPV